MFENIIGNDGNKKALENILINNTISHSYIFSGIAGIGKFLFAKEFAKAILCTSNNKKPCNTCKSCESFDNLNHPDIVIIDEQANSIKTEQIKEIANSVQEKPIKGNKKIYIINNSENMTKEAQNSLLKTLEEPPEYILIILITSNENLLLNTIKSRCIKIPFYELSNEEINEYFKENRIEIDNNIIDAFGGSIGKAMLLKDKADVYNKIAEKFNKLEQLNELDILRMKDQIFYDKEDIYFILDYINTLLYKKILNNISKTDMYNRCIKCVEDTKLRLKRNSNYDMTIDNFCLNMERSLKLNG